MLSKEEIEKAKEVANSYIKAIDTFGTIDYKCINNLYTPIKTFLQYTEQLEQENKKLNKMIDKMATLLGSLKLSKDREGYEIMEKEDWKQYFEEKVERLD